MCHILITLASTQTILIIDREKHATVCNIGESSTLEAASEIHFTTAKVNGLYLDSKLHVTSTEDQLRVWPNNFSKTHCQDYLGHLVVNKMAKNETNLVTVGDTALVWNVGEMNGRDIRLGHESALLKYHDQVNNLVSQKLNVLFRRGSRDFVEIFALSRHSIDFFSRAIVI